MRRNGLLAVTILLGGVIISQLHTLQEEIEYFEEKKRIFPKRKIEEAKRRERLKNRYNKTKSRWI